ncbi:U3 small nucleolar RNA-associated protein 4 [Rhizina undulata]
MSQLNLHRCRFVDYPPSSITSLSFSHPSTPTSTVPPPKNLRLAIGRTNGSIEIWNPLSGSWHHETTLQGGKDRSIEGLTWVQDYDPDGKGELRLFSIGYSSVVTEWDLAAGRPRKHLDCNGGVIWSIAAQPRVSALLSKEKEGEEEQRGQMIVVGTEDGGLTLLSTDGGRGELSYVRTLMRSGTTKSRVLSIVWQNRHTVVAGMADSTIRVWDIRNGRSIARMSLNKDRGRDVLVWAVKILPNGDVVSGDSRGEVCFWDGKNYSLRQRIKGHEGDCLALEVGGKKGDTVFSAGVDMRTIVYRLVGEGRRWGETARRRFHKHDVRAMAGYECGAISVIVSGGVDMTPIVIPLRNFGNEFHLTIPGTPQSPILSTVPQSRLMMSFWEREVKVWRIEELNQVARNDELYLYPGEEEERGRKLLSRIMLNNEENITSGTLSTPLSNNAGHILAVSTIAQIKLFHLRPPKPSSTSEALRVQKIVIPTELTISNPTEILDDDEEPDTLDLSTIGARLLKFSPDGKWLLVITPTSRIFLAEVFSRTEGSKTTISISPIGFELDREIPETVSQQQQPPKITPSRRNKKNLRADEGSLAEYESTITRATFSSDSRLLAVSDLSGIISTFTLTPSSWAPHPNSFNLPKLSALATMSFRPGPAATQTEDRLLVITANNHFYYEFHALTAKLSEWSRRNPPAEKHLGDWRVLKDRAVDMHWEEAKGAAERVWIWGARWVWMLDLSADLPDAPSVSEQEGGGKRKRPTLTNTGSGAGDKIRTRSDGSYTSIISKEQEDESEEEEREGYRKLERAGSEDESEEDGDVNMEVAGKKEKEKERRGKAWWGTYRYKNLLGFLPMGRGEVVVVERPGWDVEMPARFYAK